MKKWIALPAMLLILAAVASCEDAKKNSVTTTKTPAIAVRDTFWIDVRTPGEFEDGHLTEATNIPLQVLEEEFLARVPRKDMVVALYCRSGNRSGQALRLVQEWGYTKAFNAGGFANLSATRK